MANLPLKPRRSRWFTWFVMVALLLLATVAALVWFGPGIFANSAYRDELLAKATKDLNGKLSVRSLKLGWLDQVELLGVVIVGTDGQPAVEIERVVLDRTLWQLLQNQNDLGTITVERPVVLVHLDSAKQITNLEEILAHYLKPSEESNSGRPALQFAVKDGFVKFSESSRPQVHELQGVTAQVMIPAAPDGTIKIEAAVASAAESSLKATVELAEHFNAKVVAVSFELEPLGPLLRRFEPGLHCDGNLSGTVDFSQQNDQFVLRGSLLGKQIRLHGDLLRGDRVELASFTIEPFELTARDGILSTNGIDVQCDLGTLHVKGELNPSDDPAALLSQDGLELDTELDIAKLVTMLPRLAHLREGVTLSEGMLSLRLASRTEASQVAAHRSETAWRGRLATTSLRGSHVDKPIVWEQPLSIEFDAVWEQDRPRFNKLEARSDFFALAGRGKLESFLVMVNLNLDRLSHHLVEFIDLNEVRFGGSASIMLKNDLTVDGQFQAEGTLKLSQAFLRDGQSRTWQEPSVDVSLSASGTKASANQMTDTQGDRWTLNRATMDLLAGEDQIEARLLEPIADLLRPRSGQVEVTSQGELARWLSRIRPWVDLPQDFELAGQGPIRATIQFTEQGLTIPKANAQLQPLRLYGFGLRLDEPQIKLETAIAWQRDAERLDLTQVVIHGDTLVWTAPRFELGTNYPFMVKTKGNLTANVNRVQKMLQLQSDPAGSDAVNGLLLGPVDFEFDGNAVKLISQLKIEGFLYGPPQDPSWREPLIVADLNFTFDSKKDELKLSRLVLARHGLGIDARGTVGELTTRQNFALQGELDYDLDKLEPQLRELFSTQLKARGAGKKPFALNGRVSSGPAGADLAVGEAEAPVHAGLAGLQANAGLAWQQLYAYGFEVGPTEFRANMKQGQLNFTPIEAKFGDGLVKLQPSIDFSQADLPLTLKPGLILERAKLTPSACADAFGFVLPAIANSASADGTISMELSNSHIPLDDPAKATFDAKLFIHEANATASPMITELIQLLGISNNTMVLAKDQAINIKMANGRVFHEDLLFTVGQSTIKMNGSVGIDRTLELLVEVPAPRAVLANLLPNNPLLRDTLTKQRLVIPIRGTLGKPALDKAKFDGTIRELIRDAGRDAIKDAGGGLLERILRERMEKKKN